MLRSLAITGDFKSHVIVLSCGLRRSTGPDCLFFHVRCSSTKLLYFGVIQTKILHARRHELRFITAQVGSCTCCGGVLLCFVVPESEGDKN